MAQVEEEEGTHTHQQKTGPHINSNSYLHHQMEVMQGEGASFLKMRMKEDVPRSKAKTSAK